MDQPSPLRIVTPKYNSIEIHDGYLILNSDVTLDKGEIREIIDLLNQGLEILEKQ
ncbi:hypothetical protein HGI30_15295 [Paenibacillus albicereus]|uniref:Uncharacterized protein n=1 Tax=Paenibacillus albicereus TaxID=2726185 RepID=A0A6H2GZH6_9BACL|nr:hypothetical protein [Paenibacillus albicereus]QJC52797.1 hypothetical protein HGI30_15295 [Paenibacillus albicereus]